MIPEPRIEVQPVRRLIGNCLHMSLQKDRSFELFSGFMPRKKEIKVLHEGIFSLQTYKQEINYDQFTSATVFAKWAAVEVDAKEPVPDGLKEFIVPAGKYAVFIHKGTVIDFFQKTNPFIYKKWLPSSGFRIASRPHFQIMGEKYLGHNNPKSEEEVWVPLD